MHNGWIKLHRKILKNPVVCKDSDYMAVWMYLLLNATSKSMDIDFGGKVITLNPGQLVTGRKAIGSQFRINDSKVERILKRLETEQQIEQQSTSRGRLITILSWSKYQSTEQQIEQRANNHRTTSEQQVNTNKNVKEREKVKNVKEDIYSPPADHVAIIDHLNLRTGSRYKASSKKTRSLIQARMRDGFTTKDFETVIDKKCVEWVGTEWEKFLRPSTLFGTKFEEYLNSKVKPTRKSTNQFLELLEGGEYD